MDTGFPVCLKCEHGVLVPLSDYGREGASIHYKAWVCTIDNGELSVGKEIRESWK